MSSRSRIKVPAKKPRSWAITLIKNRGVLLGYVEAPDEKTAELAAAKTFTLSEWQRKRRTRVHLRKASHWLVKSKNSRMFLRLSWCTGSILILIARAHSPPPSSMGPLETLTFSKTIAPQGHRNCTHSALHFSILRKAFRLRRPSIHSLRP